MKLMRIRNGGRRHAVDVQPTDDVGVRIAELESRDGRRRDLDVEIELRRLRVSERPEPSRAAGPWPPRVADRFAPSPTVIEIDREDLDVPALQAGVLHHGALIVRNLLDADAVQVLRDAIDASFDARSAGASRESPDPWYVPLEEGVDVSRTTIPRDWVESGGGLLAADSPRALESLIDCLKKSGVVDLIAAHLDDEPALSVLKTTLRRVLPDIRADVGWHQDGAFLGENIRTMNLWLALSDCGEHAATLDMVPRRLDHIVPTGTEGAAFHWSVSPLEVAKVCGPGGWQRLHFRAGDAIFFDQMNLHCTGVDPSMTETRYAIEAWFFGRHGYPMEQVPVSLR